MQHFYSLDWVTLPQNLGEKIANFLSSFYTFERAAISIEIGIAQSKIEPFFEQRDELGWGCCNDTNTHKCYY